MSVKSEPQKDSGRRLCSFFLSGFNPQVFGEESCFCSTVQWILTQNQTEKYTPEQNLNEKLQKKSEASTQASVLQSLVNVVEDPSQLKRPEITFSICLQLSWTHASVRHSLSCTQLPITKKLLVYQRNTKITFMILVN